MNNFDHEKSVGIVKTKYLNFAKNEPFKLQSGKELHSMTLAYETYGTLNKEKSNAILLLHALTGTAHAAGFHSKDEKYAGWWDYYVGPGKTFDTNKYFVICSNVIGGCNGSTGPASIDPTTNEQYGLNFPVVTIRDMVKAQTYLIDYFEIDQLLAVAGGSMGGMQALEWGLSYPDRVKSVICLAGSYCQSAQGIAFNEVGRQAIFQDPDWNKGNYKHNAPQTGLALARMIAHITYLSEQKMHEKFGRRLQKSELFSFEFESEFEVESYLHYQGFKFVDRFDANSYLYLTKALDYFDIKLDHGDGSLVTAFEKATADFLMVSFSSDWLYTPDHMRDIVNALRANTLNVVYLDIETTNGHDAFLLPSKTMEQTIKNFLQKEINN